MGAPFTFETMHLSTSRGERTAMLITPRERMVITPALLESPPRDEGRTERDSDILQYARGLSERVHLAIFRGRDDDGEGSWGFAEDVDETTGTALALAMLPGHLQVWRGMLQMGVCLFLHVDWEPREAVAFGNATDALVGRLDAEVAAGQDVDRATLDLWILKNLTFYTSLSLVKVVDGFLPEKLSLMESRMDRIHKMALELGD